MGWLVGWFFDDYLVLPNSFVVLCCVVLGLGSWISGQELSYATIYSSYESLN